MELKYQLKHIIKTAIQNYSMMNNVNVPMTKIIPGWWKSFKYRAVVETLFENKGSEFTPTRPLWVLRAAISAKNEVDFNHLTNQAITKYFELKKLVYTSKGWPLKKILYEPQDDVYFKKGEDLYPLGVTVPGVSDAKKIIALAKKMDETFGSTYSELHLEMAITSGLVDAYRKGQISDKVL